LRTFEPECDERRTDGDRHAGATAHSERRRHRAAGEGDLRVLACNGSPVPAEVIEMDARASAARFGFWAALTTAVLTVVTFALAITAIPDAGRNCQANCAAYPFASDHIASQFPGDYLWMVPAMVLMLAFIALIAAVHQVASRERKVYSLIGLCVAAIAASVLLIDYFLQFTVMPLSLEKGQLEGWALFTQYNPNGVFLALEELGFLLMSVTFLAIAPVFAGATKSERVLRWLLTGSFAATLAALGVVCAFFGIDRQDTFEITAISIVWLTLLVTGPLMAVVFRRLARP
jgi:hypothetical protein